MHEFGIAQSLVDAATAAARTAGAAKVLTLRCRVGAMRQVDGKSLADAFELIRGDGLCAGATLSIEHVPIRTHCTKCAEHFPVRDWNWRCPRCGNEGTGLVGGDELELVSIEAEVEDGNPCPS